MTNFINKYYLKETAIRVLASVSLFCLPNAANAQTFKSTKVIVCDKAETLLQTLMTQFEEELRWTGKDLQNGTTYALTSNSKDGSWTLIQTDKQVACVIGVGTDTKPQFGAPV